jgi:PPOX class probable F420-dependent enzyme
MTDKLAQFAKKKYLNLETFRKSGVGVATPVWFAEASEELFVYSLADAGKVKRIRNNPRVRIVPCDMRGKPEGEWIQAQARVITGTEADKANTLLTRKYGLLKRIGNLFSKIMNRKREVIALRPD